MSSLTLGLLGQVYFLETLKEQPGDWMWNVEFEFPKPVKCAVIISSYSNSEATQWIYADLFDTEKPNLSDYENLRILGHLIINSKGECSVLTYDQTGTSIANPDDITVRNLVNISNKYFNNGFRKLAKKIADMALKEAKKDQDKMGCLFNLGYFTLFGSANTKYGEEIRPEQFDSVSTEEIEEASRYFGKVAAIFKKLTPEEQAKMEWMYQDAKRLISLTFGLPLRREER